MRPSPRLLDAAAQHARKPLIQFVGRRHWPSTPEPQHPHPSAPADVQNAFSDFLNKFKASASRATQPQAAASSTGKNGETVQSFTDFWQAPERLWRRRISEEEMEAISSGGAY
ncbi:hypothetical protein PsYK624_000440 [Phanerochaete sordida]|uniref:Uncharacterized protein n=1 Tax=Phanerochaete sordida TaxID=48140 RepID=A0A9P3FWP5_9APHY|nr:hypothetical protein PsYK624_000440 [Phanerochaete sordida]